MMEKKALFLDLDGTTLDDDSRMPEANLNALKRTIDAGHEVVITTGRPTASALILDEKYGLSEIGCRYMIAYNGGMILDMETGEVLFQKTISRPVMERLILQARDEEVYLHTYEGDQVLAERDDENLAFYVNRNGMKKKVVPDLIAALDEESCKALAIDLHSSERLEQFAEHVRAWGSDDLDLYLSCREYLEIVAKGICKGDAVRAFCQRTGISLKNTVSAGDELNDISMLEAAGVGCAVANARPEVKRAADYITKRDNNEAAIEEIVERFLL